MTKFGVPLGFLFFLCQTSLQVAELDEYYLVNRMGRTISTREPWHPESAQDRQAILHELREIVASPQFCNSKRYPALLQYIVECTLAGKSDLLKERTLGVEVFDRPPTYDTNADTVVRYTAGEVRKRLLLYYSEQGRNSEIRISLPAGSYIPEFLHGLEDFEEPEGDRGVTATSVADVRLFADPADNARTGTLSAAAPCGCSDLPTARVGAE